MSTPEHVRYLATIDPAVTGLLFTLNAVIGALANQGAINHHKLIAYLLEIGGDLSPDERKTPYGNMIRALIQMLESAQFPPEKS